jgi:pyruvate,water dikinase
MTTVDQQAENPNSLVIYSLWGQGEMLVGGEVSPDSITVSKKDNPRIESRKAADKFQQMILEPSGGGRTIPVVTEKRTTHSLDDSSAFTLASWGLTIEKTYSAPQDIEWCMDKNGRLFVLQARPLNEQEEKGVSESEKTDPGLPILLEAGDRASAGAGAGRVFLLRQEAQMAEIPTGSVLVARNALPSYAKVIDSLRAVVTDRGSVAGHFASVARELGVPVLVNTGCATERLKHGQRVTVDADKKRVFEGIVPSLPDRSISEKNLWSNTPFQRKLKYMIGFISPLSLLDPYDPAFVPANCRSLHDIIRFVHEKGMREMFAIGDKGEGEVQGTKRLSTGLPLTVFVLDVGGGLRSGFDKESEIPLSALNSIPMQAVWQGLTHPGIDWTKYDHFDWKTFDDIALAGGMARKSSASFASYAVISDDYLNLNIRFGYHFTILDTLCSRRTADNYILLRFAGGGGNFTGRSLRIDLLEHILVRLGFTVKSMGDLLDAQLIQEDRATIQEKLDMAGRLFGATRLMDMALKDTAMVEKYVNDFFHGRYDFSEDADSSSLSH